VQYYAVQLMVVPKKTNSTQNDKVYIQHLMSNLNQPVLINTLALTVVTGHFAYWTVRLPTS